MPLDIARVWTCNEHQTCNQVQAQALTRLISRNLALAVLDSLLGVAWVATELSGLASDSEWDVCEVCAEAGLEVVFGWGPERA